MSQPPDRRPRNNLLRFLRPSDYELIASFLVEQKYVASRLIYSAGDDVDTVYFPCGGSLVSFQVTNDDGKELETILVGREGAVGGIVSLGHLPSYCQITVKRPGPFLRMTLRDLEHCKSKSQAIASLFARYADCVLAQIFQSTACNAIHSIDRRAAKWILSAMERTGESRVPLTHEELAGMLGVGRSYASRVLQTFRTGGIIETRRGSLVVRDIGALKQRSCTCNESVRSHFERVLAGVYPHALQV